MDKPKVTIKINGKERSFYESTSEDKKGEAKIVPQKSIESDRDEQLPFVDIDEVLASEEIAAANEEEEFEWILPEQPVRNHTFNRERIVNIDELRKKKSPTITSFKVGTTFKKKKTEVYPLKTLLLSIVSALVVGTCFGMVVLRMFTGETIPVATTQAEQQGNAAPSENGEKDGKDPVLTESITIPGLDVFLVQGGAFSTETAAQPIMEEIKGKGLASTTVNIDGKHFLFLGIGLTKEMGTSIRKPYDEQGQDTYVKTLSTPQITVNGDPNLLKARELFDQLLSYTTNKYSASTQTVEWASIKQAAEQLKAPDDKSTSSSYIAAVKDAYGKSAGYEKSGESNDFWKTQQALLTSYQMYQKWILEQKK